MKKTILLLLLTAAACLHADSSLVDLLRIDLDELPKRDFVRVEETESGKAVVVTVPENSRKGSHWVTVKSLNLKRLRGKKLLFTTFVKGEKISKAPAYYFGLKYMLIIKSESGMSYPQAPAMRGTFDWKKSYFEVNIPRDALSGELVAGLQEASGKASFRNFQISQGGFLKPPVKLPPNFKCEYTKEFLSRPVTRGVMSPDPLKMTEKDVDDLGSWGATNIRWQLKGSNAQAVDLDIYDKLTDSQ